MNWLNKITRLFKTKTDKTEKKVTINYSVLKMVELKVIAKEKGLKGYNKLRKADLINLLENNS
ncbi:MAG: Rho termination factor N-terminal domain-containing protein [Rhodobacteraceae bacterium]|nr:Rho termination factor N-terminal domain-containing protein [Paracoccaceae bacterium]